MSDRARAETGAALLVVLLGILIFVAVGTFVLRAVDRNNDARFAFQRSVAGFNAAEAGLNKGAAEVLTTMQGFNLPSNCTPQSFTINGRTVTYTLSVPGNAPGDCTPNVQVQTEPTGPYAGLNAIVHSYTLTSTARNSLGYTEASATNQFFANLIPVFQFASFYKNDLEILPSPPMVINGRVHTNGDLYLNSDSCGDPISGGLNILGKITIVGTDPNTSGLFRGRKDSTQSWNNVYISLDGSGSAMQVLGTTQGSSSCAQVSRREVLSDEIATFSGRITNRLSGLTLPGVDSLLCTPWHTDCGGTVGAYWQKADLRIVLDLTAAPEHLDPNLVTPVGPMLPPIRVLDDQGNVVGAKTDALHAMMRDPAFVGAITYSDAPKAGSSWDCKAGECETSTYALWDKYAQPFPRSGTDGCSVNRDPRVAIIGGVGSNYCYDYRYGGFFNWRERKPIRILNIDWIALAKYNRDHSSVLFDPNTTTNGGVVVFLSVKGPNSSRGNNYGVRIYDAPRLPIDGSNTGVTFAADVAAYVTGNFNCPAPDTSGGDSVPAGCGPAKRPSSVVADTINILSCAWVDPDAGQPAACANTYTTGADQWAGPYRPLDEHSTAGPANGEVARETVVSAAFLAGNDTTVGSWYSGGLENYPRFHENWQSGGPFRFWYQGSFVSLDTPKHSCWAVVEAGVGDDLDFSCNAQAAPGQGFWTDTRYVPPPRRWFYDVAFNNSTNLPPLTPRFVYLKLVYFTEVFQ